MAEAERAVPAADVLTPVAATILHTPQPARETPYSRLVVRGAGNPAAKRLLEGVRPAQLIAKPLKDAEAAQALLAGLWLWHDWLDESHAISQGIASPTGSFWHAIMHRREGDFSNSKYWYARCRNHPALRSIAERAGGAFDPAAFVDLVESVHDDPNHPKHADAVRLQQLEWEMLFESCARAAVGS